MKHFSKFFCAIAVSLCLLFNPVWSQQIVINEILASNSSNAADPDFGQYADWIELYNTGIDTIHLGAYAITDNLGMPEKWTFPLGTALAPGGFLLIWADGKDTSLLALHAGFKLSSSGEEIGLFDSSGVAVDTLVYEAQAQNISLGRQPDGGSEWVKYLLPTPGKANLSVVLKKAVNPVFSLQPGYYTDRQLLTISIDDPETEIRYTTNGDEPDVSSPTYTDPIPITSRAGDPNVFSEIRTNLSPFHWLPDWVGPQGEVFKASVIRARAFKVDHYPSDIVTASYFVDEGILDRYPTIPVISINADYDHLFDYESGIYVPGVNHRMGNPGTGNYFQDWEKRAHIEFFEPGGHLGFAQDVGITIQGGTSPASPQKGLHVIARGAYGKNRINYPLFEDDPSSASELTEYKRFVIRAWGSLITGALFNDAYAHRLMAGQDLDIQAYRPVVVFINGEYWGLQALRESNKNSWYYQYHHGIDRDDPGCDILLHIENNGQPYAFVDEGDADHWNSMMNYIEMNDMNLEMNYEEIKTRMDIENFINYMGHCIYVSKWDWPNNNDASWRPRSPDGKWRWIQFDMETGFGVATGLGPQYSDLGPQLNMFQATIRGLEIPNFGNYGPHPIMAKIYNNEEFREDFIDWFVERFNDEFHPDSMNLILENMAAEIRPYIQEYKHRWPFIGAERGDWESSIEAIRDFNNKRPDHVKRQLLSLYNTDKIPPVDPLLLQNYPNPFVGTTSIPYQLPKAANVVIKIFNELGEMVAFFPKWHNSKGIYSVEWNARGNGSGIYFITFEAEGHHQVKKMMLLR